MSRLSSALRYLLFAVMVASMVGLYTQLVGSRLGKLRLESTESLLVPMMVISGLVALPVYAALCRRELRSSQVATMYWGFALTCLLYGCFGWAVAPDGSPVFIVLALVVGHVLGLPLFLILVGAHAVLARLGFYGRDGRAHSE